MRKEKAVEIKRDDNINACLLGGETWLRGMDIAAADPTVDERDAPDIAAYFCRKFLKARGDAKVLRCLWGARGWYLKETRLPEFINWLNDQKAVKAALGIKFASIAANVARKRAAAEALASAQAPKMILLPPPIIASGHIDAIDVTSASTVTETIEPAIASETVEPIAVVSETIHETDDKTARKVEALEGITKRLTIGHKRHNAEMTTLNERLAALETELADERAKRAALEAQIATNHHATAARLARFERERKPMPFHLAPRPRIAALI